MATLLQYLLANAFADFNLGLGTSLPSEHGLIVRQAYAQARVCLVVHCG